MEISTALSKIDKSRKQTISKDKDMGNNIFDYQVNHKILHPYSEKDVCFILEICSKSSTPDVKYATNIRDILSVWLLLLRSVFRRFSNVVVMCVRVSFFLMLGRSALLNVPQSFILDKEEGGGKVMATYRVFICQAVGLAIYIYYAH